MQWLVLVYYTFLVIIYSMNCICPECKNDVNLARYPKVDVGIVIECDICGITLVVKGIEGNEVYTEVADEGK